MTNIRNQEFDRVKIALRLWVLAEFERENYIVMIETCENQKVIYFYLLINSN